MELESDSKNIKDAFASTPVMVYMDPAAMLSFRARVRMNPIFLSNFDISSDSRPKIFTVLMFPKRSSAKDSAAESDSCDWMEIRLTTLPKKMPRMAMGGRMPMRQAHNFGLIPYIMMVPTTP